MNKTTLTRKKTLKILRQKDNFLFHILLLMQIDSEGNYCINKEDVTIVDNAMNLYVEKINPNPETNEHSRRSEDRI